jgi:hypothetical protein
LVFYYIGTGILIHTDIVKTDMFVENWTYRHDFTSTDKVKTDMSNHKWIYQFFYYIGPVGIGNVYRYFIKGSGFISTHISNAQKICIPFLPIGRTYGIVWSLSLLCLLSE